MKKTLIILLFSACAVHAQMWTNVQTGAVAPQPSRRPADAVNVSEEWFILPGWQPFDLAQQAAWDAAEAAKAVEDEVQAAAFDFPDPEVVVPVLDASGERTGTARLLVDSAGQIVVVTDTASPQRTAAVQIAELKAKSEVRRQKMSEGKAAAASANSVPALRAAVAQIIEALEE